MIRIPRATMDLPCARRLSPDGARGYLSAAVNRSAAEARVPKLLWNHDTQGPRQQRAAMIPYAPRPDRVRIDAFGDAGVAALTDTRTYTSLLEAITDDFERHGLEAPSADAFRIRNKPCEIRPGEVSAYRLHSPIVLRVRRGRAITERLRADLNAGDGPQLRQRVAEQFLESLSELDPRLNSDVYPDLDPALIAPTVQVAGTRAVSAGEDQRYGLLMALSRVDLMAPVKIRGQIWTGLARSYGYGRVHPISDAVVGDAIDKEAA